MAVFLVRQIKPDEMLEYIRSCKTESHETSLDRAKSIF